jgi:hypothetical protein
LAGRSAVRWADWDIQTVFCGEQLPFGRSVSGPMGELVCSDSFVVSSCPLAGRSAFRWADWDIQTLFCGEQLPFGRSVNGLVSGLVLSDRVLW